VGKYRIRMQKIPIILEKAVPSVFGNLKPGLQNLENDGKDKTTNSANSKYQK
jgi:hypothetical protein